jgi:hypothetical protein
MSKTGRGWRSGRSGGYPQAQGRPPTDPDVRKVAPSLRVHASPSHGASTRIAQSGMR